MLSWLLNPKGSHGLGVAFCNAFVSLVAQRRVEGSGGLKYARKATFLKWGKEGRGVGATNFAFQNAAVLRKYYLINAPIAVPIDAAVFATSFYSTWTRRTAFSSRSRTSCSRLTIIIN